MGRRQGGPPAQSSSAARGPTLPDGPGLYDRMRAAKTQPDTVIADIGDNGKASPAAAQRRTTVAYRGPYQGHILPPAHCARLPTSPRMERQGLIQCGTQNVCWRLQRRAWRRSIGLPVEKVRMQYCGELGQRSAAAVSDDAAQAAVRFMSQAVRQAGPRASMRRDEHGWANSRWPAHLGRGGRAARSTPPGTCWLREYHGWQHGWTTKVDGARFDGAGAPATERRGAEATRSP